MDYVLSQLTRTPVTVWAILGAGAILWFAATWLVAAHLFNRNPNGDPHGAATGGILSGFVIAALLVALTTWLMFGNWVWTSAAAAVLLVLLAGLWLALVRPVRATSSNHR